ncbi:MAG: GSCFA domain-containing protein [Bacteroidales bacterium]|nr:GSCFA domain-containing protein [Bacteroidales bacterium]
MDFRTTIHIADNLGIMHHSDRMMMLGSCFSDNIGGKLRQAMINVCVNPFGTLYNPLSIAASVDRIIDNTPERGIDLFQGSGVWNSYNFHSRYSLADKEATLTRMNEQIAHAHEHLRQCHTLIVTLGTAVVYRLKDTDQVVANCHKVPQHNFSRRMASVEEITEVLSAMVERLHEFNPSLRILFTVSPIRHVADGLEVNSLSKATLRVAIANVNRAYRHFTSYFPAYEIVMDDLRDYRFYAADMVHPSEVAIGYIWQTFQAAYFDDASSQAIARCERVMKRLTHRPMSANREIIERFNADTRAVVANLVKEYPYITSIKEINDLITE